MTHKVKITTLVENTAQGRGLLDYEKFPYGIFNCDLYNSRIV